MSETSRNESLEQGRFEKYSALKEDLTDQSIDDEDSSLGLIQNWRKSPSKSRRQTLSKVSRHIVKFILLLCSLSAVCYIALGMHSIQKSLHLSPSGGELGDCGSSHTVEEARSKGCLFDPMSWLWVRPECYDKELIDNFMARTDWSWHTEWNLTAESQVPLDVVFRGDHPQLYTSKKYHSIHCTYMWQKMHKALMEHRPVDTDLTNWHHTWHCEQVLLDPYLHEDSNCTADMICPTLVRATWTSCGYF
ncbi:MAG: hypothetical protein Q9227_007979 [Pyrenula ochraceoflavens]